LIKALVFNFWKKYILLNLLCCLGINFFHSTSTFGELTAGVTLTLYADTENHPDLQYRLGIDPVKLIMVIKNTTQWPINTERGFSQIELQKSLVLTDPNGVKHALSAEGTQTFDPLPALSIDNRPTAKAESLPGGWVRSVTIEDAGNLFPMLKVTPGWYEIVAYQFFVRFIWAFKIEPMGLLAFQDEQANNWYGTVDSNTLRFYIAPPSGAQLQAQVLNPTSEPPQPINQVLVRVFKKSDLPADYTPATAWSNTPYVFQGKSDPEGWAVWESESDVQCLSEDEYVVMASYADDYQESHIPTGAEAGWTPGCQDAIKTELFFGEKPLFARFSIFALNSIWLQDQVVVSSGNLGVQTASSGPVLSSGVEICLDKEVQVNGAQIHGDSVMIGPEATVLDVYCNELVNEGNILGEQVTPLALPVASAPPFLASSPGEDDIVVKKKKSLPPIQPGAYKSVEIGEKATLILAGGDYHFESLKIGEKATLIFQSPCKIRIKGRVECGEQVKINWEDTGVAAKDAVLYVGGSNGGNGNPDASPKTVFTGEKCQIRAIIYAPNGTVQIGQESQINGSLIAKDVLVENEAMVAIGSSF
jgi:hypothetical protein